MPTSGIYTEVKGIHRGIFNPLTANAHYHMETSQLICIANQLTGFYMMGNIGRWWIKSLPVKHLWWTIDVWQGPKYASDIGRSSTLRVSILGVFLVRIFPPSDWIWRDTSYLSIFNPNVGKCGLEKLLIPTFGHLKNF